MYALINVYYLKRNKQLFICSSDSSLVLITLVSLISLTLLKTHVISHDSVSVNFHAFNNVKIIKFDFVIVS